MATSKGAGGKAGSGEGAEGKARAPRKGAKAAPAEGAAGAADSGAAATPAAGTAKRGTRTAAGTGTARGGGARKAAAGGDGATRQPDLAGDLREFVGRHPEGWNHQEWSGLLDDLRARGHDVSDTGAVGRMLERERIGAALDGVPGLGAKRVQTLSERFETLWHLRQASVDDVAQLPGITRPLAEKVVERVR